MIGTTSQENTKLEHILIFIGFLIEIVLACVINYVAQLFSSSDTEILQILLGLLIASAVITFLVGIWGAYKYYQNIHKISEKSLEQIKIAQNYIEDLNVKDITLKQFSKELVISGDFFESESGGCKVIHNIDIYNHMEQRYDNYVFNISSTDEITKPQDYKISKDDIAIDASKGLKIHEYTNSHIEKNHNCINLECEDCKTTEKGCKLYVPIGLKPKHSCKLEILEDASPSFTKLKNCNDHKKDSLESISIEVKNDIEVLSLSIILDKTVADTYIIERGDQADENCEHETFKVIDRSDQRMGNYENLLDSRGYIPKYSKNGRKLTWVIYYPKKCYTYKLYFTITNSKQKDA